MAARVCASAHNEADQNLALAVIASSEAPIVLLDGHLNVIATSGSFRGAYQMDRDGAAGRPVFDLGGGEWDVPELHSLLDATLLGYAGIEAYEMDLERPARDKRHLLLNARKLDFGGDEAVRLLLTVSDVTEARAAENLRDDLVREKAILLQELHSPVAKGLQIIASVLLRSARNAKSEETRGHLYDAHHRAMSVATVQRRLAASTGDVHLRAYFTDLCHGLGGSMIGDQGQLSLEVHSDDSVTEADVSVSLGLIVTELVINALKHAFPDHRAGKITVGYVGEGADWTLSVSDDGVGMPVNPGSARPGLGASIVEALARQLGADVQIDDAQPGTSVCIVHASAWPWTLRVSH
jgi:two-component sensor histidine kinase